MPHLYMRRCYNSRSFTPFSEVMVKYPQFYGTGYVAFPVLRDAYKEFTITIEFRPDTSNGLLIFSSELPTAKTDFFSVALVDQKVEFRLVESRLNICVKVLVLAIDFKIYLSCREKSLFWW